MYDSWTIEELFFIDTYKFKAILPLWIIFSKVEMFESIVIIFLDSSYSIIFSLFGNFYRLLQESLIPHMISKWPCHIFGLDLWSYKIQFFLSFHISLIFILIYFCSKFLCYVFCSIITKIIDNNHFSVIDEIANRICYPFCFIKGEENKGNVVFMHWRVSQEINIIEI